MSEASERAFWIKRSETVATDRWVESRFAAHRRTRRGLNATIVIAVILLVLAALLAGRSLNAQLAQAKAETFTARLCAPFAGVVEAGE